MVAAFGGLLLLLLSRMILFVIEISRRRHRRRSHTFARSNELDVFCSSVRRKIGRRKD